jgi:hypothetical protein
MRLKKPAWINDYFQIGNSESGECVREAINNALGVDLKIPAWTTWTDTQQILQKAGYRVKACKNRKINAKKPCLVLSPSHSKGLRELLSETRSLKRLECICFSGDSNKYSAYLQSYQVTKFSNLDFIS